MWDHALTVLSSIIVIVIGSVIATFVLRRFERGKSPFLIRRNHRPWRSAVKGMSGMGTVLCVIGILVIVLGCLLVFPTMSQVSQLGDIILLLGAPMVMNGMTLLFYGVIICALGKVIDLLSKPSISSAGLHGGSRADFETGGYSESKATVECPSCTQKFNIPRGNKGTIKCPRCTTRFEIDT
jgi:hypothetical protein